MNIGDDFKVSRMDLDSKYFSPTNSTLINKAISQFCVFLFKALVHKLFKIMEEIKGAFLYTDVDNFVPLSLLHLFDADKATNDRLQSVKSHYV